MRKIPDAEQLRAWDEFTIRKQQITSWDLMERAARGFCDAALSWLKKHRPGMSLRFSVICGTGNNGGDGLAIARMLHALHLPVNVFVVGDVENGSADFKRNLKMLPVTHVIVDDVQRLAGNQSSVCIDALFGSGLSRPISGLHATVVDFVNAMNVCRMAVDLPSGLMADKHTTGSVVKADLTITFQTEKLVFLLPESGAWTGEVVKVGIGLEDVYLNSLESNYALIERVDFLTELKPRKKFSHKGDYGHALVLAGSRGKMGAAVLAARAASRTGCGWVTAGIPSCGIDILQSAVPEAMVWSDAGADELLSLPELDKFSAIAVGPGIGTGPGASAMLRKLLDRTNRPLVLDADALNIIASFGGLIAAVPAGSVLTPHPGEFRRLAGDWQDDFHRLRMLQDLARCTSSWIILKGAHSAVASPEGQIVFNTTGTPWMAAAGSGDVLTGVIVSLLAQGYTSEFAARAGAFLHGRAGELAAGNGHPILAGDIINALPEAWLQCFGTTDD